MFSNNWRQLQLRLHRPGILAAPDAELWVAVAWATDDASPISIGIVPNKSYSLPTDWVVCVCAAQSLPRFRLVLRELICPV